jgi:aldose 1-epimerase
VTTLAELFGRTGDGEPVHRLRIAGGGLQASIITWGAVVQDLRLEGHRPPLVLGFESFDDYPAHSPYFGAIAGRYANRIREGRFAIDGRQYQADTNFLGKHLLHGGSKGIGKRVWSIAEHGADFVTLRLRDRDGEMGFPGNLDITCTYRLAPGGVLSIELSAVTDQPTLCNLAHHSYFNLDDGGSSEVLDHLLQIDAEAYLPVDEELIPTGEIAPVAGTDFDFSEARPIRREAGGRQVEYDHNWCLARSRQPLRRVARLSGSRSGVAMEVCTTEPGVQFYAGHKAARDAAGLDGRQYRAFAGVCLEPQVWPDSPNHPDFPQAVLRPGEVYRQTTQYRFAKNA